MVKAVEPITATLKTSALTETHIVFELEGLGANITRKKGNENTLWAKYKCPDGQELQIAVPRFPGAGEAPENTISLEELTRVGTLLIRALEDAIKDTEEKGAW